MELKEAHDALRNLGVSLNDYDSEALEVVLHNVLPARKIQVEVRSVYGNELIYPVCQNAKLFASIAGKKTLSKDHLHDIKALGFTVEEVLPKRSF